MDQSSKLPILNLRLAESSEAGQAGSLKPLWSSMQLRKSGSDLFRVFVLAVVAFALFALCGAVYAILNGLGLFEPGAVSELKDPRRLHQYHENSLLTAHYDAREKNLWLGTGHGAELYDLRTRLWQTIAPDMTSFPVRWITQSGEDVFLGDGEGTVHRWLNGRLTPMFGVTDLHELDFSKVVDVSVGRHEILIALARSLIIYERRNRQFTRFVHDLDNETWREAFGPAEESDLVSITSLAFAENEDTHYIGTGSGLFTWRRGKWLIPEHERPDRSPVLKLDYNDGVLWYVRSGVQGSMRVGRIIDRKARDFMTPGRLNVPPADTRDITRWQNFLFMGTKNQFLRVCNVADRSWESVSFNQTSDAPEIRQLEVHSGKLWLATDRGLLVFADSQRLWEIGRSAEVPVFRAIYGYLDKTTESGLTREDVGVRKMLKTPSHLWFVTEKSTLARISLADEKVEWLIQDSRALVQAETAGKGLGYQIKPTDLLSVHSSAEHLLVGTRRGVFRYDMAEHLWSTWQQEIFGEQQIYYMADAPGGGLVVVTDQQIRNGTITIDHPPDDKALRLYSGKGRTLYSTAKGSLGQISDRTRIPLISGGPSVEDLKFTSVAQTSTHLYFATDGNGIQVYDPLTRRWEETLAASPGGLPSDSIMEVRAGRSFLASRSAQGGITLRLDRRWVPLIGEGKIELEDKDITAISANGEHLWIAGRGLIAAYHIRNRAWSKPISLKTSGHVKTLHVVEGKPLALTSEGELFKGEILLAEGVNSLAAYGSTFVFLRKNELNLRSQWGEETQSARGLPEDTELRDVAETRRFFLAAATNNLYAYDKDARTWQSWGSPPVGEIRELATKDGEVLAKTETDTFRCAPQGLWPSARDAKLEPRGNIRVDNEFWIWIREGEAIRGAFKGASNTPIFTNSGGQKKFSFDTVNDLKVAGETVWLLTQAGPIPLPGKPALTPMSKLVIPPTGPVDDLLAVSSHEVGVELKILAIAPMETTWEFLTKSKKWKKASASESSDTAPSFAPDHRHTLVLDDNWRVEAEKAGERTVLHKWQRIKGNWKPFHLVNGRWSFDDVQSMFAQENKLWLVSTDTVSRIEFNDEATEMTGTETFDWPRIGPSIRFRFLQGRKEPTFIAETGGGLKAFEIHGEPKGWKAVALAPAEIFESEIVGEMPSLKWVENYSNGTRLSAAIKYSDGTESVISLERPFPFDRFHSALPGADSIWLSTDIGIAECLMERSRLPLNEVRFHRAGKTGGQLLRLEESRNELQPGVYYRSPDGSAWQMPDLANGMNKVAGVKKTFPVLKLSGEEDVLHEFDGFWRWVRERNWDHTAEPKMPLVKIEALDSGGNWAEIEFEGGRFAFDKVNDILTSEGSIWLATDGGLCGFPMIQPNESGELITPLGLAGATIFPDLSPATELVRDSLSNQLFIRLQQKAKSVYSLNLPDGKPLKMTGSANPFRKRPRLTDGNTRWSHLEEYAGDQLDHTHLHLDIRGPRGLWQEVELETGLLPIDNIRDFKCVDQTIWLATPAGMVAWNTTKPPGDQEFRFYAEPGDVWRLLKKDSDGPEIMCLSSGERGLETYRFSKAPVEGKHWLQLDKPSLFRARIAEDSHWHWYRELAGISILWRGLLSRRREILHGRFADEMALAVAVREKKLFAWTPSGIALYAMGRDTLELTTIYEHPEEALGSVSEPVAMGFDGAALYAVIGKRVLHIRAEGEGGNYSIIREWQLVLRDRPDRLLLRPAEAGLFLETAQHSPKPFFQWFKITDAGPEPINRLTGGSRELEIGEGVSFCGESLLSGRVPTAGIIPLPDGYWIAGKKKALRLR